MKFLTSKYLSFLTLINFILIFSLTKHTASYDEHSKDCTQPFNCGNIKNLSYPFWGENRPQYCGLPGFELHCDDDLYTTINISSQIYRILATDIQAQELTVARADYWDDICPSAPITTNIDTSLFDYALTSPPIFLTFFYGCPNSTAIGYDFPGHSSCIINGSRIDVFFRSALYFADNLGCSVVSIPILEALAPGQDLNISAVLGALHEGFQLKWKTNDNQCRSCKASGGHCGNELCENKFICFLHGQTYSSSKCLTNSGKSKNGVALAVGLSVGGIVVAALACTFLIVRRRRRSLTQARPKETVPSNPSTENSSSNFLSSQGDTTSSSTTYLSQSTFSHPSSKSNFENSADYFGVKVFPYHELEEATENFHESRELGDGGFGAVYYGKLNDGRIVAVKRLYENSVRHMGQFMNEIRILAHLRHKNLVTLYGCTSKRSRDLLLVYEYIPNGTVADHLHGKFAQSNVLPWSTRLNIAVETAEALSFLHEKEVIHRDVKTTNILLDNSYQVKVADFGLSRLFPPDVTHVSTAPQGTPGYVDPEYYQCYQLTEKSDVYSFGVVLAELISSKAAVDTSRDRLDINLANMVVDRIQKHALDELIDPKLGFEKDFLAGKMMKLVAEVAFQCLQQERDMRPSMKEVLESLKGIQKEMANAQKQVVVDIYENDDVGLLKNMPPPLSPETDLSNKSISR